MVDKKFLKKYCNIVKKVQKIMLHYISFPLCRTARPVFSIDYNINWMDWILIAQILGKYRESIDETNTKESN
ncbi:hypothetical protein BpHYR1_047146 [Brachionus plicatilis]|uniref:Uncharacterized protein n=1 Tax=Brachionus plicatilis TaxID=10195 RepID=A0A3M7QQY9_BRAPC|nr:hypothetical protein BpHYR1_047146 [Brachionus plicatilis]